MKLPDETRNQIAFSRKRISEANARGKKPTKADRLLVHMSDCRWHTGLDLATNISWRFGGYLHDLKKRGVEWEKRRIAEIEDEVVYEYRLVVE